MTTWPGTGPVLCVGEALVALNPPLGTGLQHASQVNMSAAGAELNVSVHLARLGVAVAFAGRVGDDPLGRLVRDTLIREGVGTEALEFVPGAATGVYFKDPGARGTRVHYYRAGSAASSLGQLSHSTLSDVGHVHLTGITLSLSAQTRALVTRLVSRPRSHTVSFDVNFRAALWTPDVAAPITRDVARAADVVFVGLDEAVTLWGADTPQAIADLLTGPREIVVKDGAGPAMCLRDGAAPVAEHPVPMPVVEPVGAGDAFAAGYLAARFAHCSVPTSLRLGHAVAAGVLSAADDVGPPPDVDLVRTAYEGKAWTHADP